MSRARRWDRFQDFELIGLGRPGLPLPVDIPWKKAESDLTNFGLLLRKSHSLAI